MIEREVFFFEPGVEEGEMMAAAANTSLPSKRASTFEQELERIHSESVNCKIRLIDS